MDGGDVQVLVVDDEPGVCEMIRDGLTTEGFRCRAVTEGTQARQLLDEGNVPVLLTDVVMSGVSGLDLLAHVRRSLLDCRVILMTGVPNTQVQADATALGAYDWFQKPLDMAQVTKSVGRALADASSAQYLSLLAAKAIELENHARQASLESIRALAKAVEAKDHYTSRHSEQVARYAVRLASRLSAAPTDLESIRVAALLHDIGKIGIPDNVLTKIGALDDAEFQLIRKHPLLGAEILEHISALAGEAKIVRHHHENWDGNGYPDGLAGEDIPWGSRIINIADAVDAMLMKRTYKDAYPVDKMLSQLQTCAGKQFDPAMAVAAIEWCKSCPRELILPQ